MKDELRSLRMMVTGTDTGVGKTTVSSLLAWGFRSLGHSVGVGKPVMTGLDETSPGTDDLSLLAGSAGVAPEEAVCPYRFGPPLSPHLAARMAGVKIDPDILVKSLKPLFSHYEAIVVEGVGGLMTPLSEEFNQIDLALLLDLPLLLVARAGLGTINHTLLAVEAARRRGAAIAGIVVNGMPAEPDTASCTNPDEIAALSGLPVLAVLPELGNAPDLTDRLLEAAGGLKFLDRLDRALQQAGTDLPASLEEIRKWDNDHLWHPFTQMKEYGREQPSPPVIVSARGCRLFDAEGHAYIDGISSMWAVVHGHGHPYIDAAVASQLSRLAHSTLLGLTHPPAVMLARRLAETAPAGLDRVFFSDDGSTAMEAAAKIAFQYWRLKEGPKTGRTGFAAFSNAYHGDTIGDVSLGGIDLFHAAYRGMLFPTVRIKAPYCYRCHLGLSYPACGMACRRELEEAFERHGQTLAALAMEPLVQGAGGMIVSPPGYLAYVRDLCRRNGVLLIADEVATGFGRTGSMFACEQEDVVPDLMALSKGITSGYLPLGATLCTEELYRAFLGDAREYKTFYHGHTFTGNPLASAAALASLDLFEREDTLGRMRGNESVWAKGMAEISELPCVGDIRRRGYMAGIELVRDRPSREAFPSDLFMGRQVILEARRLGAIIRPIGDVVTLLPPPAISGAELEELLQITAEAIRRTTGR